MPAWVTVSSALLTPLIAIIAAYVAWQQWQTNRNKLKLELFDRRLAVYQAARSLIGAVLGGTHPSDKQLFDFLSDTAQAHFLLGENVGRYLFEDLYRRACALAAVRAEMEGLPQGEQRTRNIERQRELREWFLEQHDVLDEKFAPYLKLKH